MQAVVLSTNASAASARQGHAMPEPSGFVYGPSVQAVSFRHSWPVCRSDHGEVQLPLPLDVLQQRRHRQTPRTPSAQPAGDQTAARQCPQNPRLPCTRHWHDAPQHQGHATKDQGQRQGQRTQAIHPPFVSECTPKAPAHRVDQIHISFGMGLDQLGWQQADFQQLLERKCSRERINQDTANAAAAPVPAAISTEANGSC